MPFYEFECPKGHVTEKLVPMGTKHVLCETCIDAQTPEQRAMCQKLSNLRAHRILSATPTTFVAFGGRKL